MPHHDCDDLITLFNNLFKITERTILVKGGTEPIYFPSNAESPFSQIIFTQDYYSSALHEIAHWCVAGEERRKLMDYGYWYRPDGRNAEEQKLFEQMEIKPQALEWIFSVAAGVKFKVSADNLSMGNQANPEFQNNIQQQAMKYLQDGLPDRAEQFKQKLLAFYQHTDLLRIQNFRQTFQCGCDG